MTTQVPPPVEQEPAGEAPWGLRGAALMPVAAYGVQAILFVIVGLLARTFLLFLDPNLIEEEDQLRRGIIQTAALPVALGSSMLTLGLIYVSVTIICRRPFSQALGLARPQPGAVASSALLGVAVALVYIGVAAWLPPDPDKDAGGPLTELATSGLAGHLIWLVMAVVLAPVVEEILFRGYSYLGARGKLGSWGAGVGVTLMFVAMHVAETGTYWPALAGIATMAVILVVIMQRTGNLTRCIACHLGYNATLALLTFLPGGGGI